MKYKPANWSKVYKEFRDEDGYYTANLVMLASTVVNSQKIAETQWPKTAEDFLRPEFKDGQLVIVHPSMDDIVLFYFKQVKIGTKNHFADLFQVVDKYGFEYLTKFAAQNPTIVCDGFAQFNAIGFGISNATAAVAPGGIASIVYGNESIPKFAFPSNDDPFSTYAMYMAIFKKAKMPETAKLYVNWLLEKESPVDQK